MKISRKTFIKGAAATVGSLSASRLLFRGLETLTPRNVKAAPALTEDWMPTTCWIGKQDCGMLARRINGRVVKFEGHPGHPRNQGTLCPKGVAQIMAVYDPNRVKAPLLRTNEKGVPGQWRQVSWDEALTLAGDKIKEARARDRRLLVWQHGRDKAPALYREAFVSASGATMLCVGAQCSFAAQKAVSYTIGPQGALGADFRHTRYLLAWGWNITGGGGNWLCWITWPRQMLDARDRGMKVVAIDPRLRGSGPFADQWLPIRPGTDLALALALCHVLIEQGTIDWNYLKKHTNAPFLIKEDGYFLRVKDKEQVWDQGTGSVKPYDAEGSVPALEGEFTAGGHRVRPAFQFFKEHIARYTPEVAADICGLSADAIRRLGRELGENAMIGSTVMIDGIELPYRPVAIMAYRTGQQELGFQAVRAMVMVMMLLGAVEAVGGQRLSPPGAWAVDENYWLLDEVKIKDPPSDIRLEGSKYFPIGSGNSSMVANVMLNPQKYGVDYVPEVLIVHMNNAALTFPDQKAIWESYKKFKFIAVIDPWLSKTADYFADVVLPAATVEKYEGPVSVSDQYTDATALRLPPMEPLFQSRGEIEIYLDLCEKAGFLFGKGGYLDAINKALTLWDSNSLDLNRKPTAREILDRWARSRGIEEGIVYFEKKGVKVHGPITAQRFYGFAQTPPFEGLRHRLYGESLLRYRQEMQAKGAAEVYWRDYTAFPAWRTLSMEGSPSEYDLYLVTYKMMEFKESRSSHIPLLAELAPEQRLCINPKTARQRGIQDGDEVWVESHNAFTGETRRVNVKVAFTEGIRPDVVAMPHHYGEVARHPWASGQGPTPNALYFSGEGYVANTQDQSYHVKVRVYKSGVSHG